MMVALLLLLLLCLMGRGPWLDGETLAKLMPGIMAAWCILAVSAWCRGTTDGLVLVL